MAITLTSSALGTAANKIVKINTRSENSFVNLRRDFQRFGNYLEFKTLEIQRDTLPNPNALKKLEKINVASSFGSAGGLLSSLASGALDVGGFIRGIFPGKDKKIGAGSFEGSAKARPKPILRGSRLRIPGVRAFPIINTIFAGLDFATGLAEGESIGKSAAGTAGSLAGSLLGGMIGQTLIPIPGLGFVVGSAVGGFIGGWGADRAYDAGSSLLSSAQRKQEEKLKEGSKKDGSSIVSSDSIIKQNTLISTFEESTNKFSGLVNDIINGKIAFFDMPMDQDLGNAPPSSPNVPSTDGGDNLTAEGGVLPSKSSITSEYGPRDGRTHRGVDYQYDVNKPGTPISIIRPGVVSYVGFDPDGYGNLVIIKHSNGIESLYGHLHKINVRVGQQITPGTVIGTEGTTGRSTGYHVHFELRPAGGGRGSGMPINRNEGDNYFRFGGNVRVTARPGTEPPGAVLNAPQSDLKPGQSVQTPYGTQSSMPTANIPATKKNNIKGYVIVPGHITGGGADGERAAVEKIAINVVNKIKAQFPGVPIMLWNHRTYGDSTPELSREMEDLKKLEAQGWQVIELHLDRDKGTGRGVILPYNRNNVNPVESIFAEKFGVYPQIWGEGGLGGPLLAGPKRNISIFELGNITSKAKSAFDSGDQNVIDYFSRDVIDAIQTSIRKGDIYGYTPTSRVSAPQQRPQDISHNLPYNQPGNTVILNNQLLAMSPSVPPQRPSTPIQTSSSGGSTISIVPIKEDVRGTFSQILQARLSIA